MSQNYKIAENQLEKENEEKDYGVIIKCNNFKVGKQCQKATNKATKFWV
jgi:hypothetical protein